MEAQRGEVEEIARKLEEKRIQKETATSTSSEQQYASAPAAIPNGLNFQSNEAAEVLAG